MSRHRRDAGFALLADKRAWVIVELGDTDPMVEIGGKSVATLALPWSKLDGGTVSRVEGAVIVASTDGQAVRIAGVDYIDIVNIMIWASGVVSVVKLNTSGSWGVPWIGRAA